MDELCRVILLAYMGEKTVAEMDGIMDENPKIREALDFCWKWIECKQADVGMIYDFLDDEDEDDLVGYMLDATNEREKKEYGLILGVVSYISANVLETNKLPMPQFLEGIDDKYYNLLIADVIELNISDCKEENINRIIGYCESKIAKNETSFTKVEVMTLE